MAFGNEIIKSQGTKTNKKVKKNRQKMLSKLSERRDRPLGKQSESSVKALDDVKLPDWIQHVLVLGPKHRVRDKFNETDICLSSISKIMKSLGRPFVRWKQWQKPMLKG